MSALPKPEQLVDDFMLNDRRFGDSDLKLIIRSSGRSSFGIIPGMVCVFDSSMGDGQVFQVHCAIKKDDGPSVLAPYARKRTQDRFILLQSLYQYVDAESDDPTGWPLEFAGQRLLPLRKDLKLHPVVLARQLGVSPLDLSMWEAGRISPGPAMYEWGQLPRTSLPILRFYLSAYSPYIPAYSGSTPSMSAGMNSGA